MNAIAGLRPARFTAATYLAFRVTPMTMNGFTRKRGNHTALIDIGEPVSLPAAVAAAQGQCSHKDHLAIHESVEDGNAKLHIYVIKQKSTPSYEYDRDHTRRRVITLYAAPVCVIGAECLTIISLRALADRLTLNQNGGDQ